MVVVGVVYDGAVPKFVIIVGAISGVVKLGDNGTAGATEERDKFEIVGVAPRLREGFVYAGALPLTSTILGADAVADNTAVANASILVAYKSFTGIRKTDDFALVYRWTINF